MLIFQTLLLDGDKICWIILILILIRINVSLDWYIDSIRQRYLFKKEKDFIASSLLGAGRMTKDDVIDHAAGMVLERKTGNFIREGDVLAWLYTNRPETLKAAEDRFRQALTWGTEAPVKAPLIYGIIR